MIEKIEKDGSLLAVIVYNGHQSDGVSFITDKKSLLQLGYMNHPTGYRVKPHSHNKVHRHLVGTQEVLFIKKGKIKIDFYSHDQVYLESRELSSGDIVLLIDGGHGITILHEATIVEVKNGPYVDGSDKSRFDEK